MKKFFNEAILPILIILTLIFSRFLTVTISIWFCLLGGVGGWLLSIYGEYMKKSE
jgi:hypothetical protein